MIALLVSAALAQTPAAPSVDGWVLRDVRIVDALGERTVAELAVRGGRIVSVGEAWPSHADWPVVPSAGLTVVPGLIDAHVHLSMTPGGAFLELTTEEERVLWAHHLRAYVASGVAAVLDTGIPVADAWVVEELVEAGPAPEVRWLGPLVSPVGGYVSVVLPQFPGVGTAAELEALLVEFDALDPIGVKVTMEDGMLRPIWPWQADEVVQALVAQPRALFVHAMEPEEYARGLALGPRAFVHPPDKVDDALVQALRGIPVVTTLSVMDSNLAAAYPERLDDPLVVLTVPELERAAGADPERVRASFDGVTAVMLPGLPGVVRSVAVSMLARAGPFERLLRRQQESVRALHEAGVELVAGSDSGNWPLFLYEFHGPTSVRELELLQDAGIAPLDVLRIGTLNGARLLDLERELGTVVPGKRASFMAVRQDPLVDIAALRDAAWVVLDGERRTPAEWMDLPAD